MSNHHQILLVEDSPVVQTLVCASLKNKYTVKVVSTVAEALREIKAHSFSLIILDVELPDGDGFKVCAQLKLEEKYRGTSIVFLSGKSQISDKVMGLSLGADDYISKPIEPLEFQARIAARIRNVEETRHKQENLCVGPFRVVASQQKIFINESQQEITLNFTTTEFKLFYYLLRHEEQVLSREQILNAVWGELANITDRTVDTHVYTIRQKLGAYSSVIQAIPRAGYRYSQIEKKIVA